MAQSAFASGFNFLNSLQTLTKDRVLTPYIVDIVFRSNKAWGYLQQKGMVADVKGGLAMGWPINVGVSPNTATFWADDTLPVNSMNANIIRAEVDWKGYQDALVVTFTDSLLNDGSPDSVASMIAGQLDVTKMSLVDRLATDWVKNVPATKDPKGFDGLASSVDDGTVSGSYAGVSRTSYPLWKSNVNYQLPSASSILNNMVTLDLAATLDAQRPDFYCTNNLNFGTIMTALFTQDAYIQPEMARSIGGTDLILFGNPVYIDSHIPTGVTTPATFTISGSNSFGYIYGLNSTYLELCVHPDAKFAMTDWQMPTNQLIFLTRIVFVGNVVNLKPSAHWVLLVQGG